MFDLKAYLTEKQSFINDQLERILDSVTFKGRLSQAMKYAVTAGGKRLRPILCLAAAEAIGGPIAKGIVDTACAIEFIHTYSLIHDDLPAMDNDDLRRGKPTCHVAFDEATAILAGDALLTLAFQILSNIAKENNADISCLLKVINEIAIAAGAGGMVEGQMRDVESEGKSVSIDELENIHRLKTGAMIQTSVISGAALAGAAAHQLDQLENYAQHIGMAFQVVDDILNVEGDSRMMGKAVGTDQVRNKKTFPTMIGMEASKAMAHMLVDKALQALADFDNRSQPLREIAKYIIQRKK
jgi:geranylgeranyl diphosphate synthase, type II